MPRKTKRARPFGAWPSGRVDALLRAQSECRMGGGVNFLQKGGQDLEKEGCLGLQFLDHQTLDVVCRIGSTADQEVLTKVGLWSPDFSEDLTGGMGRPA